MNRIETQKALSEMLTQERALIFKHSTRCPISSHAHQEIEKLVDTASGTPVYKVHVIENRELSNLVADRTGVPHASPQVILLEGGRAVWNDSHFGVTEKNIVSQLSQPLE